MLLGQMSIWGHLGYWGQKVTFTKNAITCPCYIALSYMVTLTYPLASDPLSHLRDQQATWGQSGVEVSKPAGYVAFDDNVSSCFCFCLFFFLFVLFCSSFCSSFACFCCLLLFFCICFCFYFFPNQLHN